MLFSFTIALLDPLPVSVPAPVSLPVFLTVLVITLLGLSECCSVVKLRKWSVFITSVLAELAFAYEAVSASMSGLSFAPGSAPSLAPACTSWFSVLNDPVTAPNGDSTPGIEIEEEGLVV